MYGRSYARELHFSHIADIDFGNCTINSTVNYVININQDYAVCQNAKYVRVDFLFGAKLGITQQLQHIISTIFPVLQEHFPTARSAN
jgi:hypothetical protein